MNVSARNPKAWVCDALAQQFHAWQQKPELRWIYQDCFDRVVAWMLPGPSLEVGCGIGRFKAQAPVMALDLFQSPWTDLVGDAQQLPIKDGRLTNVVLIDVLHHLPHPMAFFDEACRVLKPGGRIVLIEPYLSPFSHAVYRLFHHEPVRIGRDPFARQPLSSADPFDANQAVATRLFFPRLEAWQRRQPQLEVICRLRFACFAYAATGGFRKRAMLPKTWIQTLYRLENRLPWLSRWCSFRACIVLQRIFPAGQALHGRIR
jgi:SAM-dependent methyltransferase